MEIIVGVILIVLGIIGIYYVDFYSRKQPYLRKEIGMQWGKMQDRLYQYEELESIKIYWMLKSAKDMEKDSSGYIDTITWNDLDMDAVFAKINHTQSSIGESYLYDCLHYVNFDESLLEEFEQLIGEVEANEKVRLDIQMAFHLFGKSMMNRIPYYLFKIEERSSYYRGIYHLLGILPIISLGILLLNIKVGAILLGITIGINATIHYKYMGNLSYEMDTLNDIRLMVRTAKKISRIQESGLRPICYSLKEDYAKLKNILSLESAFF